MIKGGQVLLTGGSGFLGQYIIDSLKDYDIVVADQVRPKGMKVKFQRTDLRKPFKISKDFEIVIHLAAYVGGIQFFTKHPVENIRDNPKITGNVFDASAGANVDHIIYTSSSVVYQHQKKYPTSEESVQSSPPPSSAYGLSKLVGEYFCRAYQEQYGLDYTIIRPFNAYGPGEAPDPDYAHVIPILAKRVLRGQYPVKMHGSGKQSRTFTHGKDIASAFRIVIENSKSKNENFNVAGNKEYSIMQVLQKIWKICNKSKLLKVEHLKPLPHDVPRRYPSNKKIKQMLGWKPMVNFDDGLKETITWLRHH